MINKHLAKIVGQETTPADATQCTFTNQNGRGRRLASCHPEAAESLASPRIPNEGSVHSALFCWQMPANSKTVRRSRQFPARAPGMAAWACWIRLYCFASLSSADSLRGVFRSFGAAVFLASIPRLLAWGVFCAAFPAR